MQIVTLQAHFDGKQILLDEPYELAPNTKLIVSVIQPQDEEREDWMRFSLANLERAYGDDEPEYSLDEAAYLDADLHRYCESRADDSITLEQVRKELASIPGSIADDIIADREERF